MQVPQPLFTVTLDGEAFALVRAFDAFDAFDAADLAFGLHALQWFGLDPANDHDRPASEVAAADRRWRFAARPPTEAERHRFAVQARRLLGESAALAACIVTEEFGAFEYEQR
jgi:hypothetical protein